MCYDKRVTTGLRRLGLGTVVRSILLPPAVAEPGAAWAGAAGRGRERDLRGTLGRWPREGRLGELTGYGLMPAVMECGTPHTGAVTHRWILRTAQDDDGARCGSGCVWGGGLPALGSKRRNNLAAIGGEELWLDVCFDGAQIQTDLRHTTGG